jgi:ATP-dependent RNA helicase RhlE
LPPISNLHNGFFLTLMNTFDQLELTTPLRNAIADMGLSTPTDIQTAVFSVIRSGKDMVGIAQTGTGKTLAYLLPILRDLSFSKQSNPRILIMVPTRELVVQVVETIKQITAYMNVRVLGVYGGVNMAPQQQAALQGLDIVVATPGRLYDLVMTRAIQLKSIAKLVIDEVDVMLDLGFRPQLTNLFELLPQKRQNIMFSATMTEEVDDLIEDTFIVPTRITIALSGTPLENIEQSCYLVKNFYTKANLLGYLLDKREEFTKVLVFVDNKKSADRLFRVIEEELGEEVCVMHSNKSQNYRLRALEQFDNGEFRVMISTDVMARGLDLDKLSHVISFDTPRYPENYIHRIGRTGRANELGKSILFYTPLELEAKDAIEELMQMKISEKKFPSTVALSKQLTPEERPIDENTLVGKQKPADIPNPAFHEKKEKNKKVNLGGSYRRELAKKYKKPKTKGDKIANRKKKNK